MAPTVGQLLSPFGPPVSQLSLSCENPVPIQQLPIIEKLGWGNNLGADGTTALRQSTRVLRFCLLIKDFSSLALLENHGRQFSRKPHLNQEGALEA